MNDTPKNPEDGSNPIDENDVFETPNDLNLETENPTNQFEDAEDFAFASNQQPEAQPEQPMAQNQEPEILDTASSEYPHDEDFSEFSDLTQDDEDLDFNEAFGEDLSDDIDTTDFDDDIEAFGEDWDSEGDLDSDMNFATEDEDETASGETATSPLAGILENKAIKFGGMGVGGIAAVAALYFFVLDGGSPAPVQQPQQQQQAAKQTPNNSPTLKTPTQVAALDAPSDNNSGSLLGNLDSIDIPEADKVEGLTIQDMDNDGSDVFDILENSEPSDNTASTDKDELPFPTNVEDDSQQAPILGMPTPIQEPAPTANNTADISGFDFATFDSLPNPTPISSETTMQSPKPGQALDAPAAQTQEANGFDIFDLDSTSDTNTDVEMAMPVSPLDTPKAIETTKMDVTPLASTSSNTDMQQVSEQLAKLNDRLDRMDRRIEDLERQKSGTSNSSDMARIERMIKRLEGRIEDLADNKSQVMASNSSRPTSSAKSKPRVTKASIEKSAPAPKKAAAPKRSSSAKNWSLRGAGPGQAYVAKNGSNEIKTVRVGDKVSGLGSIKYIGLEKGRWVVKTTGGTIRQ